MTNLGWRGERWRILRQKGNSAATIFFWSCEGSAVAPSSPTSVRPRPRPCQNIISLPLPLSLLLLLTTHRTTPIVAYHHQPMDVPYPLPPTAQHTPVMLKLTLPRHSLLVLPNKKKDYERTDTQFSLFARLLALLVVLIQPASQPATKQHIYAEEGREDLELNCNSYPAALGSLLLFIIPVSSFSSFS